LNAATWEFGNSWLLSGSCPQDNVRDATVCTAEQAKKIEQKCAVFDKIGCDVDKEAQKQACEYDLCFTPEAEWDSLLCDLLNDFVSTCEANGVSAPKWREISKCPYTCAVPEMVFNPKSNGCYTVFKDCNTIPEVVCEKVVGGGKCECPIEKPHWDPETGKCVACPDQNTLKAESTKCGNPGKQGKNPKFSQGNDIPGMTWKCNADDTVCHTVVLPGLSCESTLKCATRTGVWKGRVQCRYKNHKEVMGTNENNEKKAQKKAARKEVKGYVKGDCGKAWGANCNFKKENYTCGERIKWMMTKGGAKKQSKATKQVASDCPNVCEVLNTVDCKNYVKKALKNANIKG